MFCTHPSHLHLKLLNLPLFLYFTQIVPVEVTNDSLLLNPAYNLQSSPYLAFNTVDCSFRLAALYFFGSCYTTLWFSSASLNRFILVSFEAFLLASSSSAGLSLWYSFLCHLLGELCSSTPGDSDCFMIHVCGQLPNLYLQSVPLIRVPVLISSGLLGFST